ncbi:MAG: DUF2147 domain-containing protein [Devosia sp.]
MRFDTIGLVRTGWRAAVLTVAMMLAVGPAAAQVVDPIMGTWLTQNKTEVTVAPCGTELCGTLSWIVIPPEHTAQCVADKASFGTKMLDYQNPDPALRTRSLIGITMMTLKPASKGFEATLYNPEDGKTYKGNVAVVNGGGTLRLSSGCMMGVCLVTVDWPRLPDRAGTPDFSCGDQVALSAGRTGPSARRPWTDRRGRGRPT